MGVEGSSISLRVPVEAQGSSTSLGVPVGAWGSCGNRGGGEKLNKPGGACGTGGSRGKLNKPGGVLVGAEGSSISQEVPVGVAQAYV